MPPGRCRLWPTAFRSSRSSVPRSVSSVKRLVDVPAGVLVEVVLDHHATVVLDTAHQLLELQANQAPVDTQLDDVELDLLRDPAHHLCPLQHGDDVAHRDEILHLESRQRAGDLVEAVLVALQRLQCLVGSGQQPRDRLERMLLVAHVHSDDRHVLRYRDDRHVDRPGDTFRRAVAGTGLRGRDVGVGHQMDIGAGDAAGVARQDDGAVHLRQLGETLRAEGGVEQEPARADVENLRPVAHHDQRAHARLQDAVEPLTEGCSRRDSGQRAEKLGAAAGGHGPMLLPGVQAEAGRGSARAARQRPRLGGAIRLLRRR